MKTFLEIVLLVATTSVVLSDRSPTTSLGQGFYLPSRDILGDFEHGATIFGTIPPSCVHVAERPQTKQVNTFLKNSESFYGYISTKTGISGNVKGSFTMGTTLSIKSQSITGSSLEASGISLDVYALKDATVFSSQCLNTLPFSQAFQKDFLGLPAKIENPNNKNDWLPYEIFFKKYGSHVLKEINRGSRLQQWTFASTSKSYSENDFNVRACVDLSSNTGSMKVQACGNYTSQEKHRVEMMTMSSLLDLKGGAAQTRAKLRHVRTAKLIEQFMIEAQTSPGNVLYKWKSLWNLIKLRYVGTRGDNVARALNLETYYKGILDYGCTKKSSDKVTLRWLEQNPKSLLPDFVCKLAALGCRDYDDCHLGGAGSVCYCYGSSCVDTKKVNNPNIKIKQQRFIRRSKAGSYDEGINNSCYYVFFYCDCDKNWRRPVVVWPPSDQLHSRRLFFREHFKIKNTSQLIDGSSFR